MDLEQARRSQSRRGSPGSPGTAPCSASRQLGQLLRLASEAELEAELEELTEIGPEEVAKRCRRRLQLEVVTDESADPSQLGILSDFDQDEDGLGLTPRQRKAVARTASTSIGEVGATRTSSLTNLIEEGNEETCGPLVWLEDLGRSDVLKLQACPTPSEARALLASMLLAASESALLTPSGNRSPGRRSESDHESAGLRVRDAIGASDSSSHAWERKRMATTSLSSSSAMSSSSSSSASSSSSSLSSLLSLLPSPLASLSPSPRESSSNAAVEGGETRSPNMLQLPFQLEVPKDLVEDLRQEEASERRREAALRRDLEQEELLQEARLKVMKEEHERSCKEMRLQLFAEVARQQEQCALLRMKHAILPTVK